MSTAGYSGTPLPKKLGIKPDHQVLLVNAPDHFEALLDPLPLGVELSPPGSGKCLDVVVLFVSRRTELAKGLARLKRRLAPSGGLWVAWPKKASGVTSDVTEDGVRAAGIEVGLIDNKVCAIDHVWSGLRLVIPLKDRPKHK